MVHVLCVSSHARLAVRAVRDQRASTTPADHRFHVFELFPWLHLCTLRSTETTTFVRGSLVPMRGQVTTAGARGNLFKLVSNAHIVMSSSAHPQVTIFNTHELSNLAWAFASVGAPREAMQAFALASKGGMIWSFESDEVCSLCWALARANCHDDAFLADVEKLVVARVHEFDGQSLSSLLLSLVSQQIRREVNFGMHVFWMFLLPKPQAHCLPE